MAYASDSLSLAVLEVLVHVQKPTLLSAYSIVAAEVRDALIDDLDTAALRPNWRSSPVPPAVQAIGDQWLRAGTSLALRVPSVLVPYSSNILISPLHQDFEAVVIQAPEPFQFDDRLLSRLRRV